MVVGAPQEEVGEELHSQGVCQHGPMGHNLLNEVVEVAHTMEGQHSYLAVSQEQGVPPFRLGQAVELLQDSRPPMESDC